MTPAEWRAALVKMEPRGKPWILDGLADAMPQMVDRYEINSKVRQQHFLAQVAHESDHFQTTREYASGRAYEGRKDLGNTVRGDGERFRGRGLIQITGRENYSRAAAALNQPLIAEPDLLERFPLAAVVSGWWWNAHGCNQLADRDDVKLVTMRVNGGYNGLPSRTALLTTARSVVV